MACVQIKGANFFLGDWENRLVLVKLYEALAELPDAALFGRLNHYGLVLSFCRDKTAQFINNGVRTARMSLHQHVPSAINIAGEFVRVWYPNQPETCRNCGSEDHVVKDVRLFVVSIVSVPVIALKIAMSQLNAQCVKTKVLNYLIAPTSFTVLMWTVVRKMIVLSRRRRKSKKEKGKKGEIGTG